MHKDFNLKHPTAQASGEAPPYGCFVDIDKKTGAKPWKYWSIVLHFPQAVVRQAGSHKLRVNLRVMVAGSDSLARLANCIIPRTSKAVAMLKKLMMQGVQNMQTVHPKDVQSSASGTPTFQDCIVVEDGYSCPAGYCFNGQGNCDDDDPNTPMSLPILEIQGNDGGGGGAPEGPPNPNEPPPPPDSGPPGDSGQGDSNNPCTTCNPGSNGPGDCSGQQNSGIDTGCSDKDCAGVEGGSAYTDACGVCVGGTTGKVACVPPCKTSKDVLKETFSHAPDSTIEKIATYINRYEKDFGIDDKYKLQNFLAQAAYESTPPGTNTTFGTFEENLNYRVQKLGVDYWTNLFNSPSTPNADPNKANPFDFARYSGSTYVDGEKFLNYVYDDAHRDTKHKLGNTNPGDGYKYRGRGIFQLTGKDNYREFNDFYRANYDNTVNLLDNPDLIASDPKIAVISALWYFKKKVMDKIDINSNTTIAQVTKKINGRYKGLANRKKLFDQAETYINCL